MDEQISKESKCHQEGIMGNCGFDCPAYGSSEDCPEQDCSEGKEQSFNKWVNDHFDFLTKEEMEEIEKDVLHQQEGLTRGE